MAGNLQIPQPLTSGMHGSFGSPIPAHMPPNVAIPAGSEHQIQLLLLQILSQLRSHRDCSTALDELQKEKVRWDSMEDELENKLFELRKEKRHLEAVILDLQFENHQLRKGKCNITDTWTEFSQNKINKLEKQLSDDRKHYEEMEVQWETEKNEYEKKLSDAQKLTSDKIQKVLQVNFEIQQLKDELEVCKSNEPYQEQGNLQSQSFVKDKITNFFLFLQENQIDVNTTISANKWTALHIAATYGDVTIIEILLESGADIDAKDDSNATPLMLAVTRGNMAAVQYLVRKNASLVLTDAYGYNALHRAAYGGCADIIHILIENGFSALNTPNSFLEYPLHMAAYQNHTAAVQILLDSGIPVDPLDSMSRTPLHRAAEHGNLEVAKLLVEHEANTAAKSMEGKIPWDYAVQNGHDDMALYLLHINNVV